MRLLDLCCGAGGASVGYARVGFEVVGLDINPQPRYPYDFWLRDILTVTDISGFDAYHASPPCQAHSNARILRGREHPDLIAPIRELLDETGKPYVIENVVGAPLKNPFLLCGAMFGLTTYRHRLFETNFPVEVPAHPRHVAPQTVTGRRHKPGEFIQVVGNFSGVAEGRRAMDIDWMIRDELTQAIPPAYTEHIARQLCAHLLTMEAA